MSIRKIPLKEQRYLQGDERCKTSEDEEDPSTIAFQSKMRAFLLTDRALHDQVINVRLDPTLVLLTRDLVNQSLRVIRKSIFKARSFVYFPPKGP